MTPRKAALTLVTGATAAAREAAIAARIAALRAAGAAALPVSSEAPASPDPLAAPDGHASVAAPAAGRIAVLLEGLPDGRISPLDALAAPAATPSHIDSDQLQVQRIAPGCLCCTGNLVLRVTLNRILRLQPDRLFIGLATADHLDQLRSWLQQAPYDQLLELGADLPT